MGAADYVQSEYFDGAEDVEQATDETLREAVHDDAIVSQGTNEGFLDNVDNDINTIEGSLEQKLGQAFIAEGDSVNSETEAVTLAENTASDYLWTTQQNLIETHNYHALSVHTYMEKLDSVNQSSDYGAVHVYDIESASDFEAVADTYDSNGYAEFTQPVILNIQSDLAFDSNMSYMKMRAPFVINGNGHEITTSTSFATIFPEDSSKGSINNLTTSTIGSSSSGSVNLQNVTVDTVESGVTYYADSDTSISTANGTSTDSRVTVDLASSGQNVTMDPSDLSSSVPTVTVGESDVTLTAVKVNVDPSYAQSSDDTVKVAMPYNVSDSTAVTDKNVVIQTSTSGVQSYAVPVDFVRAHDLVTQRDTLSAETYSISSQWAKDIWSNGLSSIAADDSKSVTDMEGVYDELGTYTVSADPDNPATVLSLYTGTYETVVDPANARMTVTDSNGTHENVVLFSTDMQYLADQTSDNTVLAEDDTFDVSTSTQSNSESFTSVAQGDTVQLSNGKIDTITSATDSGGTDVSSNVSIVDAEAGIIEYTGSSTIDLSVSYDYTEGPQRTFAVDPSSGERVSLNGSVTVDSITVGDDSEVSSVEIRTFDTTETNLTNVADRLDSQYTTTIEVADRSGGGFSFGDLGQTGIIAIVIIGAAAVLILGRSPV